MPRTFLAAADREPAVMAKAQERDYIREAPSSAGGCEQTGPVVWPAINVRSDT